MRITTLLKSGLLALFIMAGASAHAETKLMFNLFLAPQDPFNTQVMKPWAEDVAKATEGRVKIQFAPASLAAPPAQMDGVVKGVFDGAYMYHGFLLGRVALSQVAHLPFVNVTAKGSSVALWRTYKKHFEQANEYKDVELLSLFVFPGSPIYGMKQPIKAAKDLKGIKVFAVPGFVAEMLEHAGAGMVVAAAARSYEIISGGTVDAFAGYALYNAAAFHTMQYAKAITDIPGKISAPSFALFVNKKRWQSISEADRAAIKALSGEAFAERLVAIDKIETQLGKEAVEQGIQVVEPQADLMALLQDYGAKLRQDWLADAAKRGVDGPAALQMYEDEARANAH